MMADYPLIPLDQLPPVSTPSREHVLATMSAGEAGALTLSQILSLIESGDVDGFDDAVIDLIKASVAKATLVDGDKFIGLDSENGLAPVQFTLTNLIASIFKTARTIANAQFAAATFKLFNAAGTPRALSFITAALTADRTVTLPDANVDLVRINNLLGYDQTWQDVSGSRVAGTIYQNTTGRPIQIYLYARSNSGTPQNFQISTDNFVSDTKNIGYLPDQAVPNVTLNFIIPPGQYFRAGAAAASLTIVRWWELR